MKKIALLSTFLLAFLLVSSGALAEVVNTNQDTTYTTIQGAIDNASQGDRLEVYPETYEEAISVNVSDITLQAVDENGTEVDATQDEIVTIDTNDTSSYSTHIVADGVTFDGFVVRHGESGVVVEDSNDALVQDTVVEDNENFGVMVEGLSETADYNTIRNVIARNQNSQHGIAIEYNSSHNIVEDSEAYGNYNGFAINRQASNNTIRNCYGHNNDNTGLGIFTGPWNEDYDTIDQEQGPSDFSVENSEFVNNSGEGINIKTSSADYENVSDGEWGYNDGGNITGGVFTGNDVYGNTEEGIKIVDANQNATVFVDFDGCNEFWDNDANAGAFNISDVYQDGEIGGVHINRNSLYGMAGWEPNKLVVSDSPTTLDATENYWGTVYDDEVQGYIDGNVDYNPVLDDYCSENPSTLDTVIEPEVNTSIEWAKDDHGSIFFDVDTGSFDRVDVIARWREKGESEWTEENFDNVNDGSYNALLPKDMGDYNLNPLTNYEFQFEVVNDTYSGESNIKELMTMPDPVSATYELYSESISHDSYGVELHFKQSPEYSEEGAKYTVHWKEQDSGTWNNNKSGNVSDGENTQFNIDNLDSNTTYDLRLSIEDGQKFTDYSQHQDYWLDYGSWSDSSDAGEAGGKYFYYYNFSDDDYESDNNMYYTDVYKGVQNFEDSVPYTFTTLPHPPELSEVPTINVDDVSASIRGDISLGDYDSLDLSVAYKKGEMRKAKYEDLYYNSSWDDDMGLSGLSVEYNGDIYYSGTPDGEGDDLVKYDKDTGESEVIAQLPARPQHSGIVEDGVLWFGGQKPDGSGAVYGYDLENEDEVFRLDDNYGWVSSIHKDGEMIYYSPQNFNQGPKTKAYNMTSETEEWTENVAYTFGGHTENYLYGTNFTSDNTVRISKSTGDVTRSLDTPALDLATVDSEGYLYGIGSSNEKTWKADMENEELLWERNIGKGLRDNFIVQNGRLYVNDRSTNETYVLDTETGETLDTFESDLGGSTLYFEGSDGLNFVNNDNGNVQTIDILGYQREEVEVTEDGEATLEISNLDDETSYEFFTSGYTNPSVFGSWGSFTTESTIDMPVAAKAILGLIPLIMMLGVFRYFLTAKHKPKYAIYGAILAIFVVSIVIIIASII